MFKNNVTAIIDIRPSTSVYGTYRRLSYKPWYAIAEFVDNSTQNYYNFKDDLLEAYKSEPGQGKLRIEVDYDEGNNRLIISDNANGMEFEELERAVILDRPPENRAGRCEYGMGLKTAACWFGTTWTIVTTRLGSNRELEVKVHVPDLVTNHKDEVEVVERQIDPSSHYTHIIIDGLYKPIRGRTNNRIFDQLGSMYRGDLNSGEIDILWNGAPVSFEDPPMLIENHGDGSESIWKKIIVLEVPYEAEGTILNAIGWVGIRNPGNQKDAGFALLRRGRVIVGGPGEGYKPNEIFGQGNTFRSQRLIGEIHMDDWPVTQAKDAFDWSGGLEDDFIESLHEACQDYMDKAEGHRQTNRPITTADMKLASEPTQHVFSDTRFGKAVEQEIVFPEPPKTLEQVESDIETLVAVSEGPICYQIPVGAEQWKFRLHWQNQLSDAHWMSLSFPQDTMTDIFLNMAHPFFVPYLSRNGFLELIQKFVVALALAERLARKINGDRMVAPDDFRNFMNRVLKYVSDIEAQND